MLCCEKYLVRIFDFIIMICFLYALGFLNMTFLYTAFSVTSFLTEKAFFGFSKSIHYVDASSKLLLNLFLSVSGQNYFLLWVLVIVVN